MKTYLTLLALQIKMALKGLSRSGSDTGSKKSFRDVSRIIGIVILFLVMAVYMAVIEWYLIGALMSIQNAEGFAPLLTLLHIDSLPSVLFVMVVMISMILTLVFSLYQLTGKMYFSKDTPMYGALPISSRVLYASRLTEVYAEEMALTAALVLPLCIMYMVRLGFDFMLLVRAILVTLLSPILPLALAALLVHLLAHLSIFNRHRDTVIMVGTVLMILFQMVLSFTLSSTMSRYTGDEEGLAGVMTGLLSGEKNIITMMTSIFPPAGWAGRALLGSWPMMGLLLLAGVAAVVFLFSVCGRTYLRIALMGSETSVSRRSVKLDRVNYRSQHAGMAVFMREFRDLMRNPVYVLNAVVGAVGMPLLMIGGLVLGLSSSFDGNLGAAVDTIFSRSIPSYFYAAAITGFLSFMGGMNIVTSTAVSREGHSHGIYRSLPVTSRTILTAKLRLGLACSLLGTVLAIALLMILIPSIFTTLLLALVWSCLLTYSMTCLSLWVDCIHPKMHWNNENEAMKQNFNSLLGMLLGFAVLGLVVIFGLLWFLVFKFPENAFVPSMTVLLVLIAAGSRLLVLRPAEKKYAALEG